MIINSELENLIHLKNGGKLVVIIDDNTYLDLSTHYGNFKQKPLLIKITNQDGEFIKTKGTVDGFRDLKKGGTFFIFLDDGEVNKVTKKYKDFRRVPVYMQIDVDVERYQEIQAMINHEQRKKIFAICRDISVWSSTMGDTDSVRQTMQQKFLENHLEYEDFSLSNCSKELASDFIKYLIIFCFRFGVPLTEHPREGFEDIEEYMLLCLRMKICCICGQPAEIAHFDSIGMGRDRDTVDDSEMRKMALCPGHHRTRPDSIHNIGVESFCKKFHVVGVLFNG